MTGGAFKLIEELQQAVGARTRAKILLRCPDAIMLSHGEQLGLECRRHMFDAGWEFCQIRRALLSAMRDEHGLLPDPVAGEAEAWRVAMSRYAAGADLAKFFSE